MPKKIRNYVEYIDLAKDNDTWLYGPVKLPRMSAINLDPTHNVLAFDGVRNPSSRSNTSHKVFNLNRTAAHDWMGRTISRPSLITYLLGVPRLVP